MVTRKILEHPTFKNIVETEEQYDAVILEQFSNDALKVLSYKLKAPLIVFHGVGATSAVNLLVGNPSPTSYVSEIVLSYSSRMTFRERLQNFLINTFNDIYKHLYFLPQQNKMMKEHFPDSPDLSSLNNNVSLVLLMSHETTNQAVPLVPNMINIGGFHLKDSPEPKEHLKKFLDSATDGVVYFGMGTNLKLSTVRNNTKEVLLKTLGQLKQKVLMQWDEAVPKNVPSNIRLAKWFPQQSILGKLITVTVLKSVEQSVKNCCKTCYLFRVHGRNVLLPHNPDRFCTGLTVVSPSLFFLLEHFRRFFRNKNFEMC